VGEGASEADHRAIVAAIESGPEIEKIIHIKTLYLGPDELLVAAKLGFVSNRSLREVAEDIDVIEARVRAAVPSATVLYLEPDVYRPELEGARPATDTIVLKSAD